MKRVLYCCPRSFLPSQSTLVPRPLEHGSGVKEGSWGKKWSVEKEKWLSGHWPKRASIYLKLIPNQWMLFQVQWLTPLLQSLGTFLSSVQPLTGVIHLTLSLMTSATPSDTFSFYLLRPVQPWDSLWGQDPDRLRVTLSHSRLTSAPQGTLQQAPGKWANPLVASLACSTMSYSQAHLLAFRITRNQHCLHGHFQNFKGYTSNSHWVSLMHLFLTLRGEMWKCFSTYLLVDMSPGASAHIKEICL